MANVLVTGCNSGIGYYTAARFARAGHRVFATVRPGEDRSDIDTLAAGEAIFNADFNDSDRTDDPSGSDARNLFNFAYDRA